jgi:phosphate butyryltransferase
MDTVVKDLRDVRCQGTEPENQMTFAALENRARQGAAKKLAVVGAHDENVLVAVVRAHQAGIAEPLLFGDRDKICQLAADRGLSLPADAIQHTPDLQEAALAALALVREGKVGALMKGKISTPDLMRLALRNGLRREGRLLSHIAVFEHPRQQRLIAITDAGLIPYPTFEQRIGIIRNAVEAMRRLGDAEPRVACLSSTEEVDEKIPCSVEAQKLAALSQPGGALADCGFVDGPMDLGAAIDPETAEIKGRNGPVAGRATILHVPDVVAGNLLGKAIMYLSGIKMGGCIVGGAVPVVLLSRASTADEKYASILLGLAA